MKIPFSSKILSQTPQRIAVKALSRWQRGGFPYSLVFCFRQFNLYPPQYSGDSGTPLSDAISVRTFSGVIFLNHPLNIADALIFSVLCNSITHQRLGDSQNIKKGMTMTMTAEEAKTLNIQRATLLCKARDYDNRAKYFTGDYQAYEYQKARVCYDEASEIRKKIIAAGFTVD